MMKFLNIFIFLVLVTVSELINGYLYKSRRAVFHQQMIFHRFQQHFSKTSLPAAFENDQEVINFIDDFVDCRSEGRAINLHRLSPEEDAEKKPKSLANLEGNINFSDEFVDCLSNSGQNLSPYPAATSLANERRVSNERRRNPLFQFITSISSQLWKEVSLFFTRYWNLPMQEDNLLFLCDEIDRLETASSVNVVLPALVKWKRYQMLVAFLQQDAINYQRIVNTLLLPRSPSIARKEFPNLQNISVYYDPSSSSSSRSYQLTSEEPSSSPCSSPTTSSSSPVFVADSLAPPIIYSETILEKFLLSLFRSFVQEEIGYRSNQTGIKGLLEEARFVKLSERGNLNNSQFQHDFVKAVLRKLLTPILPPFYRLFLSGMIPSREKKDPVWLVNAVNWIHQRLPLSLQQEYPLTDSKPFGPFFYAPYLTSLVTPWAMSFLLGPSHANRRKDGQVGGMIVEKCKFLQESNCKGLCLHQCKLPAEQFFAEELGMPLTVQPNFVTQECQWSWGERPLPIEEDPDFPRGCIKGCATRLQPFSSSTSSSRDIQTDTQRQGEVKTGEV